MSIEAMKQALEVLEQINQLSVGENAIALPGEIDGAMDNLRAAIEQAEKPVAWREFDGEGGYDYRTYDDNENFRDEYIKRNGEKYADWVDPLYTAPPQQEALDVWGGGADDAG